MCLSAHVLSSFALGVQISDCVTMLRMIAGHREGGAQRYHAATVSWHHHPEALALFMHYCVAESRRRGQDRGIPSPLSDEGIRIYEIPKTWRVSNPPIPEWIGMERLHSAHRASLLHRDLGWYSQFGWDERPVHLPAMPFPVPRPGDSVIETSTMRVGIVLEMDEERRPVVFIDDEFLTVDRRRFYDGTWRRCVRSQD